MTQGNCVGLSIIQARNSVAGATAVASPIASDLHGASATSGIRRRSHELSHTNDSRMSYHTVEVYSTVGASATSLKKETKVYTFRLQRLRFNPLDIILEVRRRWWGRGKSLVGKLHREIVRCFRKSSTPASYSRSPEFKPRQTDRLNLQAFRGFSHTFQANDSII
jgi:hypothetical protein